MRKSSHRVLAKAFAEVTGKLSGVTDRRKIIFVTAQLAELLQK